MKIVVFTSAGVSAENVVCSEKKAFFSRIIPQ